MDWSNFISQLGSIESLSNVINAIDNTDIMVMLRASEAQLYQWSMGAADNSDQFKASFKLTVMQWAAIIVPEI